MLCAQFNGRPARAHSPSNPYDATMDVCGIAGSEAAAGGGTFDRACAGGAFVVCSKLMCTVQHDTFLTSTHKLKITHR